MARGVVTLGTLILTGCGAALAPAFDLPWRRHTIDDASRGADGVRLADVNGDGRLDIATGWEEGGVIRVAVHPGPTAVDRRWPTVTVGRVASPEDAMLVDLDRDGALDVVSCAEGRTRSVQVHWAPRDVASYLDSDAWETMTLSASDGVTQWMFAIPMDVDSDGAVDLVAGAKGDNAAVGWFRAPADPRNAALWNWYPIYQAGWIMSLVAADMDGDGDFDVLVSDRKGSSRGCLWLENLGAGILQFTAWPVHRIGGEDREVMFLTPSDLDDNGVDDVLVAVRGKELLRFSRPDDGGEAWQRQSMALPDRAGTGKAVAVGDINLDGRPDIVFSCENAEDKSGVMWLSYRDAPTDTIWDAHDISGPAGAKFDLVALVDIDDDGDPDVITCEERANLGVVWYENPARP